MAAKKTEEATAMSAKEEFIEIFRENVHREGAEALLEYLSN